MSRIKLSDSGVEAISKMSDGNPGSLTAMMELLKEGEVIDPQAFTGGLGKILLLDTFEIYGSSIYILWSDKCQRDTRKFVMLLRATQLGLLERGKLQAMAADQRREIDLTEDEWKDLDSKVCEKVESFQKPEIKVLEDQN